MLVAASSHLNACDTQTQANSPSSVAESRRLEKAIKESLSPVLPLLSLTDNSIPIKEITQHVRGLLSQGLTTPEVGSEGPLGSVYAVNSAAADFFFPLSGVQRVVKPPKAIYPTLRLTFERRGGWEFILAVPNALITLDDPSTPPNLPRMEKVEEKVWRERIIRGNELHKVLWLEGEEAEGVYLAEPLKRQSAFESMVFAQTWYPANFEQVANTTPCVIQERFNYTGSKLRFEREDIYRILYDMATTLQWMHQRHVVHRDVKASNIFIHFMEGGLMEGDRVVGLLGDCEWLKQGFGYDDKGFMHLYPVWDPCALFNISTPFADLYGLLVLLARFSDGISLARCTEIRDTVITNLVGGDGFAVKTQDLCEKALFSICYASALTLIFILLENEVEPDKIYRMEREKAENVGLTDNELSLKILKEEVEKHKEEFTHMAVDKNMKESIEHLKKELGQDFVGSVQGIMRLINKKRSSDESGI